jgi:hypothetical protein
MDGIFLGHNLLYQASFSSIELWLPHNLSHKLSLFYDGISAIRKPFSRTFFFFHDGISAITEPFSRTFFFLLDGISAITEPFSRIFSFFTMELWLSGSLFHELILFSRWNSGYQEAFFMNSFFFHDGTLAIRKPFSRTHSFFTMELWLSRSLFS